MRQQSGQVTPISLVLITGIIITLVGSAYIWGIPLIEKRTTLSDFSLGASFMDDLDQEIVEIANAGAGRVVKGIPLGAMTTTEINVDGLTADVLLLKFASSHPLVLLGDQGSAQVPIRTNVPPDALQGAFGESDPRVLTFETRLVGSAFLNTFTLRYIELVADSGDSFSIVLEPLNPDSTGAEQVIVSFDRTEVADNPDGTRTTTTYLTVEVV